jgi:MscS family membrane protein
MERIRTLVVNQDPDGLANLVDWPKGTPLKEQLASSAHLLQIINRYADFNIGLLSAEPTGDPNDNVDLSLERAGYFVRADKRQPILLRNLKANGQGEWRIAAETIQTADSIKNTLPRPVNKILGAYPDSRWLLETIVGLATWQWLGIFVVLALSVALGKGAASVAAIASRRASRLSELPWPAQKTALTLPLSVLIGATVFRLGMPQLGLSLDVRADLLIVLRSTQIVFSVILLFRVATIAFAIYGASLQQRDRGSATALLPPLRKAVKFIVALIGLVMILSTLGFNVSALLAGLGVGGLAVALAGQKTLENLFGGITIVLDQPVRVGDFGKFGSISGTVEDIGLRSTRIRTLDRTLVTIPNGEFSQMHIESFAARDCMRFFAIIGVRYDTSTAQMVRLCDGLRYMLATHPMVRSDPRRVRFLNLGTSALEVEIFAYIDTPDFNRYLEVREELNLRILEIVAEVGTECAFPSSVSYHAQLSPLPSDKQTAAEAYLKERPQS